VLLHSIEQMSPLMNAADETTWFNALTGIADHWGFDRVLIAMLPRTTGIRFEDAYVRSTYSQSWRESYVEHGFVHIDPVVSHCMTRSAPLVWSPELFATRPQRALYEMACSQGLRSGLSLPIHGPNQEAGMLCFANDVHASDDFWQHIDGILPNLVLLRDLVIDTSRHHVRTQAKTVVPQLTPRERECLNWTARGKSTWEISHILCCSEAAVNFHVKNIRAKFGVNSRRAAAVIAAQLGLIDPD
jgi:LuxR family transcriptional regulator, quorum-sensing system regulator LasR